MAKKKILWVDSAWQVEGTLRTIIQDECDAEVVIAETFEEANTQLSNMQFDLVISAIIPNGCSVSDDIINKGLNLIKSLKLPVIIACTEFDYMGLGQYNKMRILELLESHGIPKERMLLKLFYVEELISLVKFV